MSTTPFRILLCSAALALAGPACKNNPPAARDNAATTGTTTVEGSIDQATADLDRARADFAAELQRRLDRVDVRLQELRARTDVAAADAVDRLRVQRERLAADLNSTSTQLAAGWQQFRADVADRIVTLERDVDGVIRPTAPAGATDTAGSTSMGGRSTDTTGAGTMGGSITTGTATADGTMGGSITAGTPTAGGSMGGSITTGGGAGTGSGSAMAPSQPPVVLPVVPPTFPNPPGPNPTGPVVPTPPTMPPTMPPTPNPGQPPSPGTPSPPTNPQPMTPNPGPPPSPGTTPSGGSPTF